MSLAGLRSMIAEEQATRPPPSTATTVLSRSTAHGPEKEDYSVDSAAAAAAWVESAFQRSCLADVGWEAVRGLVESEIAGFVRSRSSDPSDASITSMLVGSDLYRRQRIDAEINPLLLEPPFMLPDVRESLQRHATQDISAKMHEALSSERVQRSPQLAQFRDRVRNIFGSAVRQRQDALPGSSRALVMGQGLAQLLQGHSSDKSLEQLQRLRRCRLPESVRGFLWEALLLDPEKLAHIRSVVEDKLARENLASDGGSIGSKSSNLLQRMCRNILENPQLAPFTRSPDTATRLVAAMNYQFLYASSKLASHVLLLLPLLKTFPEAGPAELVTMLNALCERVLPGAGEVRAMSVRLQQHLGRVEPAMLERMTLLARTPPPDLDLPHVASIGDYKLVVESRSVLPLLDLWGSTGFVGAAEVERCYFVWDQCILGGSAEFLEEFGRLALPLLKPEVMGALDSGDLYKIFSDTKDVVPWSTLLA